MKREFLQLTLDTTGKPAIIPKDNIAFAIEIEIEDDKKQKTTFTRVFLKQAAMDEPSKWVDVKEKTEKIVR